MKRLCTICARGGSQGVKNKNMRNLDGKPLIAHSIIQAEASNLFNRIAVSSDSEAILDIARDYGADELILRPYHLASDTAPKLPAIQHCVRTTEESVGYPFNTVVDLDATSPLRHVHDIATCVRLLEQSNATNILTAAPSRRSPYFNMVEYTETGSVKLVVTPSSSLVRRQDAPKTYDLNASIYVWKRDWLFQAQTLFGDDTLLYVMPPHRSMDIDSELDFEIVEFLLRRKAGPEKNDPLQEPL